MYELWIDKDDQFFERTIDSSSFDSSSPFFKGTRYILFDSLTKMTSSSVSYSS